MKLMLQAYGVDPGDLASEPPPLLSALPSATFDALSEHERTTLVNQREWWLRVNTAIYWQVLASLILDDQHRAADQRKIESFHHVLLADGRRLIQWALQWVDLTDSNSQFNMLTAYREQRLRKDATCADVRAHAELLHELWWLLVRGGTIHDSPADYLKQLLFSLPTSDAGGAIVGLRSWLAARHAELSAGREHRLEEPLDAIDAVLDYAEALGVPPGKPMQTHRITTQGKVEYVRLSDGAALHAIGAGGPRTGEGPRDQAGGNDCDFCESYACRSRSMGGTSKCICRHDSAFDLSKLGKGKRTYCEMVRKWHKAHPNAATLRGVSFRDRKPGANKPASTPTAPAAAPAPSPSVNALVGHRGPHDVATHPVDAWLARHSVNEAADELSVLDGGIAPGTRIHALKGTDPRAVDLTTAGVDAWLLGHGVGGPVLLPVSGPLGSPPPPSVAGRADGTPSTAGIASPRTVAVGSSGGLSPSLTPTSASAGGVSVGSQPATLHTISGGRKDKDKKDKDLVTHLSKGVEHLASALVQQQSSRDAATKNSWIVTVADHTYTLASFVGASMATAKGRMYVAALCVTAMIRPWNYPICDRLLTALRSTAYQIIADQATRFTQSAPTLIFAVIAKLRSLLGHYSEYLLRHVKHGLAKLGAQLLIQTSEPIVATADSAEPTHNAHHAFQEQIDSHGDTIHMLSGHKRSAAETKDKLQDLRLAILAVDFANGCAEESDDLRDALANLGEALGFGAPRTASRLAMRVVIAARLWPDRFVGPSFAGAHGNTAGSLKQASAYYGAPYSTVKHLSTRFSSFVTEVNGDDLPEWNTMQDPMMVLAGAAGVAGLSNRAP